jgi:hypothetical protein
MHKSAETVEPRLKIFLRIRNDDNVSAEGTPSGRHQSQAQRKELRVPKFLKEKVVKWRRGVLLASRVEQRHMSLGSARHEYSWHSFTTSAETLVEASSRTISDVSFEQDKREHGR